MVEPPKYRRWRVTFARGGVALAFAVVVAAAFASMGAAVSGDGLSLSTVAEVLALTSLLIAVPAAWLVPAGMLADHYLSRWGFTLVLAVHVIGAVIAYFVLLAGLTVWAVVTDQAPGGPLAFIFAALVPPWMLTGNLVALAVPHSFPRGRGLVMDAARWVHNRVR